VKGCFNIGEKEKNLILVKILLRSLYFLVKNQIPHTTMFEGVIQHQIENGLEELRVHKKKMSF